MVEANASAAYIQRLLCSVFCVLLLFMVQQYQLSYEELRDTGPRWISFMRKSVFHTKFSVNVPHVGQIDQTDHDLDYLEPIQPLWDAVHDLYSTDPTQQHVLDHADYMAATRQRELDHTDHTDHTDQEYICPGRQI